MSGTLVHVAAHPDDELLGAPATLMALRDAGWRIVNVACGLGRPEQQERREAELREACRRAGFELRVPGRPIALSRSDDLAAAEAAVASLAAVALDELAPDVVCSPSPHDRHHGHEAVARGVRSALAERGVGAPAWWLWSLWQTLPLPTLVTGFGPARLGEIAGALAAHEGEVTRGGYDRLLRARAELAAALAPELLYGFGAPAASDAYAELLTEVVRTEGRWLLGRPRRLDPRAPLAQPGEVDVSPWLLAESVTDRFGPPAAI